MTKREKCLVMKAFDDGAEIEFQTHDSGNWSAIDNPGWNWVGCMYRIKPKEIELPGKWNDIKSLMADIYNDRNILTALLRKQNQIIDYLKETHK